MSKMLTVLVLVLAIFGSSARPVEARGRSGALLAGMVLGAAVYSAGQQQNQQGSYGYQDQQSGQGPYCYGHGGYHPAGVSDAQCNFGSQPQYAQQVAYQAPVAQSYAAQPMYAGAMYAGAPVIPVNGGYVAQPVMVLGTPYHRHGYIPDGAMGAGYCPPAYQPRRWARPQPVYGYNSFRGYNNRRW